MRIQRLLSAKMASSTNLANRLGDVSCVKEFAATSIARSVEQKLPSTMRRVAVSADAIIHAAPTSANISDKSSASQSQGADNRIASRSACRENNGKKVHRRQTHQAAPYT
jgi:hypothetical protein